MPDEETQPLLPVSRVPLFSPIRVEVPSGTWREILAAKVNRPVLWFLAVSWVVIMVLNTFVGLRSLTNNNKVLCCCEKELTGMEAKIEAKMDAMSNLVMKRNKQEAGYVNNNAKRGGYVTTEELGRHTILLKQREAALVALAAPETCAAHEMVGPKQAFRKKKNKSASLPVLSDQMRAILVDWLIEVHQKFELRQETLYLTINIIDQFLSKKEVPRNLQLVGISAMLIACRYEEHWAPEVNNFVQISEESYVREQVFAHAYESEQVLEMEKTILEKLLCYTDINVPVDSKTESMVYFIADLGMMNYSPTITYPASLLAPSSTHVARSTVQSWTRTFKH